MKKRVLSLCLALCFILSAIFTLASCGDGDTAETTAPGGSESGKTEPAASASETEVVTAEPTTDKWEEIAPKITMLAARDRTVKIEYSMGGSAEKWSRNDIYLAGPDTVEDGVTPLIQQMIYERNEAAKALLGVSIVYTQWDYGFGAQAEPINIAVKGNAADAPDLFVNMLNDLGKEMMNGSFKEITTIPGSFFDFNAAGWLTAWMENLSFTGERAYILGSDYFLDIMRAMSVLPFNVDLMDENAVKLAGAIIGDGDPLGTGEDLSTRFFDLVETGGWTWDVLGKLCEAIWVDTDNNEQDSIYDQLGIIADGYGGINAASFVYSCGEELTVAYNITDPTNQYYNQYHDKQWIKYADNAEAAGLTRIYDEVKDVFEGKGSLTTSYTFSGNTPEAPGASYHHTKFAASELLFAGVCTLGALEDEAFQQMTDLYSVVPCPKTDATKSYNTIIINQGDAGAINVNVNPRKAKTLSAFIQYCTEHSPDIRNQFLQIVMKYKVTTYHQGTDRMLDIIYKSILYGRDKTVDDLNVDPRWHRLMMGQKFVAGADYITTQYESFLTQKQRVLDQTMEKWYNLPKVEN